MDGLNNIEVNFNGTLYDIFQEKPAAVDNIAKYKVQTQLAPVGMSLKSAPTATFLPLKQMDIDIRI